MFTNKATSPGLAKFEYGERANAYRPMLHAVRRAKTARMPSVGHWNQIVSV